MGAQAIQPKEHMNTHSTEQEEIAEYNKCNTQVLGTGARKTVRSYLQLSRDEAECTCNHKDLTHVLGYNATSCLWCVQGDGGGGGEEAADSNGGQSEEGEERRDLEGERECSSKGIYACL